MKGKNLDQLRSDLGAESIEIPGGNGKTENSEDIVLQQAAAIQRQRQAELTQRMQRLLTGKIPAPNEFVAYMLKQMKNLRAEGEALNANIDQAEHQLRQMHERSHALQVAHNKYIQDIQEWDRPLNNKAVKEKRS